MVAPHACVCFRTKSCISRFPRTKRSSKLRLRGLGMSVNHESGDILVQVKAYKAPTLVGKVLGWSLYAQLGAKAAWHEASNAMRQVLNF